MKPKNCSSMLQKFRYDDNVYYQIKSVNIHLPARNVYKVYFIHVGLKS